MNEVYWPENAVNARLIQHDCVMWYYCSCACDNFRVFTQSNVMCNIITVTLFYG